MIKIYDECIEPEHRNHFRGVLSMAKTEAPDTGGSQFFLTFVPTEHLNGKHTVFGKVRQGQDVVNAIRQGDKINSIAISEELPRL